MLTLATYTFAAEEPIAITPLPDGVVIAGSEDLRQVVASWDIFVTISPPPFPSSLARKVVALSKAMTSIMALSQQGLSVNLDTQVIRHRRLLSLLNRQQVINPMDQPGPDAPPSRNKRGLVDLGGTILNGLFGVATEAQLNRFYDALAEVSGNQNSIAHAQRNLASIVNQTREYVNKVALRQLAMKQKLNQLNSAIQEVAQLSEEQDRRITAIELVNDLDNYILILELAVKQYMDQLQLFDQQRNELQIGHLTRHLLSEEDLDQILAKATVNRQVSGSKQWLYQFLTVTPIYLGNDKLVYQIMLPLVAPRPYLLYQLISNGVPINESTYQVNLQLNGKFALDSTTSQIFIPTHCIGHAPRICAAAPEFDTTQFKCVRGLLTNRPELSQYCKLQVKKLDSQDLISQLNVNQYAVMSFGEKIVAHCAGKREKYYHLPKGTFNISCLSNCQISGPGWAFYCVDRLHLVKHYEAPQITIPAHFDLKTISFKKLTSILPEMLDEHADAPLTLDMRHLTDNAYYATNKPKAVVNTMGFINVSLIVCLWLVIAILAVKGRHLITKAKAKLLARFTLTQPHPPLPEALPLTNTTQVHLPNPKPPTQKSLWPSLAQFANCHKATIETQPPSAMQTEPMTPLNQQA